MLHFVGTNQAGKRLMMRCLQNCSGAPDLVHRQAMDIQLVFGMMVPIFVKSVCVSLKGLTAVVISTFLNERLTLSSSEEIDIAVRNPDTGKKLVWTNSENVSKVYWRLEFVETPFFFFATSPLRPFEATVWFG